MKMNPCGVSIAPVCGSTTGSSSLEQVHQQGAIGRDILDILEHRPAAIAVDGADGLANRQAVRRNIFGADPDRDIARIIFDPAREQAFAKLRQCFDRQQGMIGQMMVCSNPA